MTREIFGKTDSKPFLLLGKTASEASLPHEGNNPTGTKAI
jgi:hypothetical protein